MSTKNPQFDKILDHVKYQFDLEGPAQDNYHAFGTAKYQLNNSFRSFSGQSLTGTLMLKITHVGTEIEQLFAGEEQGVNTPKHELIEKIKEASVISHELVKELLSSCVDGKISIEDVFVMNKKLERFDSASSKYLAQEVLKKVALASNVDIDLRVEATFLIPPVEKLETSDNFYPNGTKKETVDDLIKHVKELRGKVSFKVLTGVAKQSPKEHVLKLISLKQAKEKSDMLDFIDKSIECNDQTLKEDIISRQEYWMMMDNNQPSWASEVMENIYYKNRNEFLIALMHYVDPTYKLNFIPEKLKVEMNEKDKLVAKLKADDIDDQKTQDQILNVLECVSSKDLLLWTRDCLKLDDGSNLMFRFVLGDLLEERSKNIADSDEHKEFLKTTCRNIKGFGESERVRFFLKKYIDEKCS